MSSADLEAFWSEQRRKMVDRQLRTRDIEDPEVLAAMGRVPRHRFVDTPYLDLAYHDRPLPIGKGQTISQPYIVALSTQLAKPSPAHKALDVGTGSGYQAAILASLVSEVYTIEVLPELAEAARDRLEALGYDNVSQRCGDGSRGWPEQAPFDVIVAAAAPALLPEALVEQLKPGGRLVLPIGTWNQELVLIEKLADGSIRRQEIAPVRFVPMIS